MKARWCVALVLFAIPPGAYSQERGIDATTASSAAGPQKWAVVVGVGDYSDPGIADLPTAINDAQAVAAMLTSMPDGFPERNVLLLCDGDKPDRAPTRSNVIRFLASRLPLVGSQDTLLFYFAGHGATHDGSLYLLPNDATLSDVVQTGYAFANIEEALLQAPAQRKILILDACHSGAGRSVGSMNPEAFEEFAHASQGMVILSSCSGNERSYEMADTGHGAFTHFFLEAISGKADRNSDGYVTATEASVYTWDATRRWASERGLKQTPWRREQVAGEIVLARNGMESPSASPGPGAGPTEAEEETQSGTAGDLIGEWKWEERYLYCKIEPIQYFSCDSIIIEPDGDGLSFKIDGACLSGVKKEKNFVVTGTECHWTGTELNARIMIRWSYGFISINQRIQLELRPSSDLKSLSGHAETIAPALGGGEQQTSSGAVVWVRIE